MIEKMQFVSITGPKADIDRVVDQYLSRYEIHLENALAQLQTLKTLTPYLQINPYKGLLAKALEYEKLLDSGNIQTNLTMTLDEAVALIESFDQQLTRINEQKKELEDLTEANDYDKIFSDYFNTFIVSQCNKVDDVVDGVPNRHGVSHSWYHSYPSKKASLNAILLTDFIIGLEPFEGTQASA